MGEVIQLQGDQRKDVQEFLVDKEGLELDAKTIKVCLAYKNSHVSVLNKESSYLTQLIGPWFLNEASHPLSRRRLPSTPQTPRMAALVPQDPSCPNMCARSFSFSCSADFTLS